MKLAASYAEATPRERAAALLDPGTMRELLGPHDAVRSPHLAVQGLVGASDDGVVVARGELGGEPALVIATDGRFLGGSLGEVGGAKIAAALERAQGLRVVIAFDTGGIRLQEANLGILAISEIADAIVALRAEQPVVALIGSRVGAYGGMALCAALCSDVIISEGARWGLNGPEVIEQEAGVAELDTRDRPRIWRATGGRARVADGLADALVPDDIAAFRDAALAAFAASPSRRPARLDPARLATLAPPAAPVTAEPVSSRGLLWFDALRGDAPERGEVASVRVADVDLDGVATRLLAVVPDPSSPFPRARAGELGVREGYALAAAIRSAPAGQALLAIVDVPGQAFGFAEETLGIHAALAAALDAYAVARRAGTSVGALVVGKAISGAFLAHGLQAGWIAMLDDPAVEVHVMSAPSVARVTRMPSEEIARLAGVVPATARDAQTFAALGAVDTLLPATSEPRAVRAQIAAALADAVLATRSPRARLEHVEAVRHRTAALDVRRRFAASWT